MNLTDKLNKVLNKERKITTGVVVGLGAGTIKVRSDKGIKELQTGNFPINSGDVVRISPDGVLISKRRKRRFDRVYEA